MSAQPFVALGELMALQSDSVDPRTCPDEVFDLYSIPAFDSKQPDIVAGRQVGSPKQAVRTGDVLLSKIVPHIRRSWVVGAEQGRRLIASGEWIVFRGDRFDPRYLRHALLDDRFHGEFMRTVSGVGGSLLRARPAYVAKIEVRLPDLREQRRIADVLDRAEMLRAKRRAVLAMLESVPRALFLSAFGDPVSNPRGWPIAALGGITSKIGSGSTPTGGDASYKTDGISLIRSMNVRDGEFSFRELAHIDETQAARLSGVVVAADDVLLNITGASVARVCRAPGSVLPARVNQHVCIVRPTHRMHAPFLEQVLLNPKMKRKLLGIAESGATRQAITKAQIEGLVVPLPPVVEQECFARHVAAIEKVKSLHRDSLARLDELFASLQHRAFRGEL